MNFQMRNKISSIILLMALYFTGSSQCTYSIFFNNCTLQVNKTSTGVCSGTGDYLFNVCNVSFAEYNGGIKITDGGVSFISLFSNIDNYATYAALMADYETEIDLCCFGMSNEVDADTLTFNIAENYGAVADANGNLVQGGIYVSNSFLNGGVRIGGYAGNDTMGIYNTAIGYVALKDAASTARENVAIGYQALEEVEQDNNIAIGAQAFNEVRGGSNNVAIGYRAGYNQYLTNNDNTIIGSNSTVAGNSSTNEVVIGANLVGQGDSTVNIGYDPTDKYLKAYLPDTIQTEIITNAAGDVIDVSAGAGGGSSKATFNYYGAFFSSTVPAPSGLLPTVSTVLLSSPQRYNTIVVPVTAQLKKVVIKFTASYTSISDGDITIDLQERGASGSGRVSVESQTVAYTEDITEGDYDQIFEFTFSSSAVVGPGSAVWLELSGTFTGRGWGNLIWSAYFEEI